MPRIPLALAALSLALASCSSTPAATSKKQDRSSRPTGATATVRSSPLPASPSASPGESAAATPTPMVNPSHIAGAAAPRAGRYLYAQKGSEKFCTQTSCGTPAPLPATMTATVTRPGSDGLGERVTVELRIADGRLVRLALGVKPDGIRLDELYGEFTESGVTQSATLHPRPPIRLVTKPYRASANWSGTFTDGSTTGRYSFVTRREETIRAAGRQAPSWRVEGSIEIDGEYGGTMAVTMWLDEATSTFLRLVGALSLRSTLARYEADFNDTLQSGPGF